MSCPACTGGMVTDTKIYEHGLLLQCGCGEWYIKFQDGVDIKYVLLGREQE